MTSWYSILLLLASFPVLDTGQYPGVRSTAFGKEYQGTPFPADMAVMLKPPSQPGVGSARQPSRGVPVHEKRGEAYEAINQIALAYAGKGNYQEALEVVQKNLYAFSDLQNWSYLTDNPGLHTIVLLPEFIRTSAAKARILKDYFKSSKRVEYLQASLKTYRVCLKALIKAMKIRHLYKAGPGLLDDYRRLVEEALSTCFEGMEVLASPVVNEYAFWFIEQGKALRSLETLGSYPLGHASEALPFLSQVLDSIETQYSLYSKRLREPGHKDSINIYVNKIRNIEDQYDSMATKVQALDLAQRQVYYDVPVSLASCRGTLNDEDNVFSYFQGDTAYYLLAADKSKGILTRIDYVNDLIMKSGEVMDVLKSAHRGSDSLLANQLHQLHDQLVRPVQEILSPGERLIVFPDGFLNYLPFGLLLDGIPQDEQYSEWPFMILNHPISYDYSARHHMSYEANENPSKQRYLGVAPNYVRSTTPGVIGRATDSLQEASGWGELIYNQEEVTKARALFGGSVLLGDSATKNNFLESIDDVSILHLGTHAYLDEARLDRPGVIFRDFEPDGCYTTQGFLSFPSLGMLRMNAEIVLLSASRMKYGPLEQGVGIVSAGKTFKRAGCYATAMSVWKANDYATSKIVSYFTRNLANGLPKDRALRQAKLKYLQDSDAHTSHPYFWGSFVLYGDSSPLSFTTYDYTWVWTVIMVLMTLLVVGSFYINRLANKRRQEGVRVD